MTKTKIEWATDVWNPTVGCTKISQGCKNCYAERIYERFHPNEKFTSEVRLFLERLDQPLHWKKPRRIFVDSMSDLFHESIDQPFIAQVFATMAIAKWHTFIILTKRPKRMFEILGDLTFDKDIELWQEQMCFVEGWCSQDFDYPLPNVWLGVSAEDQKTANERIPWLLKTPAVVKFVSVEPMLEKIDLYRSIQVSGDDDVWDEINAQEDVDGESEPEQFIEECEAECDWVNYGNDLVVNPEWYEWERNRNNIARFKVMKRDLLWVICGCESGQQARPMDLDWARSLRDQCQAAEVPFFLKQANIDGKLVKMPAIDGEIWDKYPIIDNNYIENR